MAATTHPLPPSRRQRTVHDLMVAAASAAIAFPIGLIVAYGGPAPTAAPAPVPQQQPAAPTFDSGSGVGQQADPTQQLPGRPDGFWTPSTTRATTPVPPRVQ